MTRVRAAWIAAGVLVLTAVAYLAYRRRDRSVPVTSSELPVSRVVAAPAVSITAHDAAVADDADVSDKWQRFEESTAAPRDDDVDVPARETPLAPWARVAIIAVALVAFFAVSLLARKQA